MKKYIVIVNDCWGLSVSGTLNDLDQVREYIRRQDVYDDVEVLEISNEIDVSSLMGEGTDI
jgi:hypothetical protein